MPDYSIPMQTREIRIKTPSEAMREAAATKNAMMAVQDQQESRARKQRMNALYEQSGGDIDAMLQSGGLDMDTAIQLHGIKGEQAKLQAQAAKEQAAADKNRLQAGIEKLNYGSQLLAGATPENWQQIRAEFGRMTGADLGEQYDAGKVESLMQQGLSMKDRLANEWKEKGYNLDVAKFGEQQRHNVVSEGISQQNANRYSAGGSDGGKWKVDLERGVRYDEQGNVEQLPSGPIAKPESAAERAARVKVEAENRNAEKDFQNSMSAAQEANSLFSKATGSGAGKARDATAAFFGKSTEGAQAAAQLKVVAGKLVAAVPKFSGPQSDADVKLYREMAGQVGDESLPVETRKAALQTVVELQRGEAERRRAGYQPAQETTAAQPQGRSVVRSGTLNGRKVVQYSDGTTEYAD